MTFRGKNILVVAAHPDDEILGCGGTIARAIKENGATIQCVFAMVAAGIRYKTGTFEFAQETKRRQNEAIKVSKMLKCNRPIFLNFPSIRITREIYPDLSQSIEEIIRRLSPDTVFVHNASDNNFDHRIVFEATMTACRPQENVKVEEILAYEVPSATDDHNDGLGRAFVPNVFVNIEKYVSTKTALLQVYKKELRESPHARSLDAIDNLAKYRGSIVNQSRCEAFKLIRRIDVAS
jgi:LmbE family N-acetylglucosaminyl deacetylase